MESNPKKFALIDGHALIHRAFHALPAMKTPSGKMSNAVYGFTAFLIKFIKEEKPDYIAATFDLAGPTFRHEAFDQYKATRQKSPSELNDQVPLVKEILQAFGVPVFEQAGYEADDVIGTLAKKGKNKANVIIATGDLDTLQLVEGDKICVYTLKRGFNDTVLYNEKAVFDRYGLKPEQLNDYRGLKGDPSDNIPGVPGVGEKTAIQLIQKFGNLGNLFKKLEKEKKLYISEKLKQNLMEHKEDALFSKQLSEIITDLDITFAISDADWRRNLIFAGIETKLREFGFLSLIRRLGDLNIGGNNPSSIGETTNVKKNKSVPRISTRAAMDELGKLARASGFMATELDGEILYASPDSKKVFGIDYEDKKILQSLGDILNEGSILVIGHDVKALIKELNLHGVNFRGRIFDTRIAAYMLNIVVRDYNFNFVYQAIFNSPVSTDSSQCSLELVRLYGELNERLEEKRVKDPFEKIEMPLIPVLTKMEQNGIAIDETVLKNLNNLAKKDIARLEKHIYKLADIEFNINSPSQLSDVLFERLKVKDSVKKTGTGARSTAAPELEKLRESHEIIDLILQYREIQKLNSTYIEPFANFIQKDKRIRTTYDQTGAATGRLASRDPNLQNIPVRTELGLEFRSAFVPAKGYAFLALDYSQIDLRMTAHLSKDKNMIDAFQKGEDIHTRTASQVFDVKPREVTKEMRRQAKVLNFGIIYGMGSLSFSRSAKISRTEADKFIKKYFTEFSGVAEYMERMKTMARENGFVATEFGHRRYLPEINSGMPQLRAQAERIAINMPAQGTAADVVKLAMVACHDYILENKLTSDVRMLLQIHDELLFEVRSDIVHKVVGILKELMEGVHKFEVPLVVDAKTGPNWKELTQIL